MYLPGWTVLEAPVINGEYVAKATYAVEPEACEKCGTVGQLYRHGRKETAFRDAPVHGKPVVIKVAGQKNLVALLHEGFDVH